MIVETIATLRVVITASLRPGQPNGSIHPSSENSFHA